ncbi:MAG: extracellular solute-binding protein [Anaerolineae bacterium]|nr:extracellular solute-binding protein [Candidatus Roseilinea sp.]MDW8451625.1 extracellular solute-binding protein [Anaerolineae bacterium]
MNSKPSAYIRLSIASLLTVSILAVACAAPPPAAAPAATGAPVTQPSTAKKKVSILNREMTDDEIKAEIQKEGKLVVANWTYTANDELVKQFKQYVKDKYGVDIQFIYEGTQAPSTYLTNLYAALKAGNPSPYDVMAIEENYWAEAVENDAVQPFLPSDLIPNQNLVLEQFQRAPTAIGFQATATPAIVYSKSRAPFMKSYKDLADPRLKGKVTLPLPGDITAGGFLLGMASELGKDYKDPNQMKETVDWVVDNVGPNVLKYTTDSAEMQQLLRSGAADAVVFWNSLARLEFLGPNQDAAMLLPKTVYPVNGYLWIPKNATSPVLAQIFINWRLSPEVQFPNNWPIDKGPWAELHEGILGPAYADQIPDWFKADYYTFFPKLEDIEKTFAKVDWKAYNDSAKVFQDHYAKRIGQ